MLSCRTTSSESMTSSTSRAPRASAASRPAMAARDSASLLVARPIRRGEGGGGAARFPSAGAPAGGGVQVRLEPPVKPAHLVAQLLALGLGNALAGDTGHG